MEQGNSSIEIDSGIGIVQFSHPKGNSLPGILLRQIASQIDTLGENPGVKVVLLRSDGEKTFCGGASFDEFLAISDIESSTNFFSGFAKVILAIRRCPKFVVARVQGKAVGGGVGVAAACDYAMATDAASIRLSELALGIGPFIIGPIVQRKLGVAAFSALSIGADWRDASWAARHGLYANVYNSVAELDSEVKAFCEKLTSANPDAMAALKRVLWEGTENWEELLFSRVAITAKLALSDFAKNIVTNLKNT